jgi:prevent-host-death family protein
VCTRYLTILVTEGDTFSMKSASVAELKARLSEYLAAVRRGEDVVVTDRGRPVARLTPLATDDDARLQALVRAAAVRPPRRRPDPARSGAAHAAHAAHAIRSPAVADPEGLLMRALLDERSEGR